MYDTVIPTLEGVQSQNQAVLPRVICWNTIGDIEDQGPELPEDTVGMVGYIPLPSDEPDVVSKLRGFRFWISRIF